MDEVLIDILDEEINKYRVLAVTTSGTMMFSEKADHLEKIKYELLGEVDPSRPAGPCLENK